MDQHQTLTTGQYHAYDERIANEGNMDKYPCPCKICLGGKVNKRNVIYNHIIRYGHSGRSPWADNYYEDMIDLQPVRDEDIKNIDKVAQNTGEEVTDIDEEEEIFDEGIEVARMFEEGLNDDWAKSMEDILKPLYANCRLSHLTTILQILNLQVVHGWTNESVDQLLALLSSLLPNDSTLPKKRSQCKNQISKLGLAYKNIHTCVNGCVLFHKTLENESECPRCHEARYRQGLKSAMVPRKVLRHFPIIPRLLRMYRCREIAELMQWHDKNKSTHGK